MFHVLLYVTGCFPLLISYCVALPRGVMGLFAACACLCLWYFLIILTDYILVMAMLGSTCVLLACCEAENIAKLQTKKWFNQLFT